MKIRSVLFSVLLAGVCFAGAQETFKPGRTFKVGESDTYTMKMNMVSSMGDLDVSGDMTQTVKKVYENGDADIETGMSNMVVNMGGQEMKPPAQPPQTMKVNKFGLPLSGPASGRNMNFGRFAGFVGDKELKVGETVAFDVPDEKNPKNHQKGTVKLVSIANGKATIDVTLDSYTEGNATPMHLDGTTVFDTASGKMWSFHGKAKDLPSPGGQGMTITSAEFNIEHK